jgi:diguanylate cyclase (GGDEF)-like protein
VGSFKVRLAAYFVLIALLPFAAAFQGFHSLVKRSETRRVDAVLETGLRSALVAYEDELEAAQTRARRFADRPDLQRALARHDRSRLARLVAAAPNIVVRTRGSTVGTVPVQSATRVVSIRGEHGRLGQVIAVVPLDDALDRRLQRRAGLQAEERLVFTGGGRVLAGNAHVGAALHLPAGETDTVSLGDAKYRALSSEPLPNPQGAALAVLAPQSAIDRSAALLGERLTLTMLITLVLLILIAYFEGRTLVSTLGRFVDAAHDIARGRLERRIDVKGRDEFAKLGRAFNEMADQLQARLRELNEERRRLRDATMRFGETLAATHDVSQLLRVVVETAVESTGASGGAVVSSDNQILASSGDFLSGPQELRVPLSRGGDAFGTLVLAAEEFTQEQEETAEWLVNHASVAIANAQSHRTVQRQANVDDLTGLANRRLCEEALEKEIARVGRSDEPLGLIVADLDDFKAVNDRYGHPAGDDVLRQFALVLRETVREVDIAARWGGEEFAVVLPGTDLAGAVNLAERIRAELKRRVVTGPGGNEFSCSASFGVAAFAGDGQASGLLAAADDALYRAKRAGKNCVSTPNGVARPSVTPASLRAGAASPL